jgi:hypothetical protein
MFALSVQFYIIQWACVTNLYTATKIDAHKAMSLKRQVFPSEQVAPYIQFSFYHKVGQGYAKSKRL